MPFTRQQFKDIPDNKIKTDNVVLPIKSKVIIMKDNVKLEHCCAIMLRHPKTGSPAQFLVSSDGSKFFELMEFTDAAFRSWFIDNTVIEDGSFLLATPLHPAFLALPYLVSSKQTQYAQFSQMCLDSTELRHGAQYLLKCEALPEILCSMTDVKDVSDTRVYRFNQVKAFEWLKQRHRKLVESLRTSHDLNLTIANNDSNLHRYAFDLLCDYVPESLHIGLKAFLNIEDDPISITVEHPCKKPRMEDLGPAEDYYQAGGLLVVEKKVIIFVGRNDTNLPHGHCRTMVYATLYTLGRKADYHAKEIGESQRWYKSLDLIFSKEIAQPTLSYKR